ncbi:flagellar basal body-associated protein FliL [Salinisphaera sp. Q1T1-3]|uniref:flagellar basal body-associated protein FliL n=1 Tax=Salinisphaera sp. Q1T1-3 TaxID=2321229 RepID=UPI000E739D64|nr:flagellar basal body-associated protein FliL [Salinisphaera sp. Q1T1-3]RJS95156.1 flagellar basal body-associated protein FliL [Salinisphaera sp. Q1T1-3]
MTRSDPLPYLQHQRGAARTFLLVGIAMLVLLLAAGGAAAFYFMHGTDENAKPADVPPPEPTFVTVDPMTVNISGDARVLYIGLSLNVADAQTAKTLESHMPEVRNRMLITLSDQSADRMTTAEGKRKIAGTLRETLRKPYNDGGKPMAINNVLFTHFIVQ